MICVGLFSLHSGDCCPLFILRCGGNHCQSIYFASFSYLSLYLRIRERNREKRRQIDWDGLIPMHSFTPRTPTTARAESSWRVEPGKQCGSSTWVARPQLQGPSPLLPRVLISRKTKSGIRDRYGSWPLWHRRHACQSASWLLSERALPMFLIWHNLLEILIYNLGFS